MAASGPATRGRSADQPTGRAPASAKRPSSRAGVYSIRSVVSSAQTTGRRSSGRPSKAVNTSFAASGSTQVFHSAVGVVLPG